jgi:hypothetical protein
MRPSFQVIAALVILFLAGTCCYFGLTGFLDGSVEFPSKRESFQVVRAVAPKTFWACVLFWLIGGAGFFWLALVNIREAARRA